ncbi:MAG: MBOAT family protein [Bacteroidales bacterium]|jgi:D-alanyl-lipoteichoic acid acyltransferase DltB (MBOAT superfamily)|nr:MBOAT family protein [Bacteroidales bacterium]
MLFNSFTYLLFFPLVCVSYWILPIKYRQLFLLAASYYFYMNWEPVYGCLILLTTFTTWICARYIQDGKGPARPVLLSALIICFGILFIFKYENFVTSSINNLFTALHIKLQIPFLNVLLPVGISFYTFQAVGYVVDVYKRNIEPEKNFFTYALFISFFPQLVAGPIERAKNLLPQFRSPHTFSTDKVTQGLRLILWGYFMKVVIADRLSDYVDAAYNNFSYHNGGTMLLATFFFTFQIYCDFGGYSNIAVGCAKIMGFDLMTNFKRPYLAVSVADFWRRWHISLSTWFKDYFYIPLGGNRCSKGRNYYNLLVTFVVSGIWHGANWTFFVWGALNGSLQIIEKTLSGFNGKALSFLRISNCPKLIHVIRVLITFGLISAMWVFFRANSISDAFLIFDKILFRHGSLFTNNIDSIVYGLLFILVLITSDIFQERNNGKHILLENSHAFVRYFSYMVITLIILAFGVFDSSQFIYFQF